MLEGRHPLTSPRRDVPHVALLVETSLRPGRDIIRGIMHYLREHEAWSLYYEPRGLAEGVPSWLQCWEGDGIIVRAQNRDIVEAVKATGLPVVDVLGVVTDTSLPLVHVDNRQIARLAATHLLERGFHHFAFFGITGENWSEERKEGFSEVVSQARRSPSIFEVPRQSMATMPWERQQDALAEWLKQLPKPVGIMVASDQIGPHLLEACRRAGLEVPDDIGVVGVDNDKTLCDVCNPPMSSVDANHHLVGYRAAALLDSLLQGEPRPEEAILVAPKGVFVRRSTEIIATEDLQVAMALRIIRDHACSGLTAADVISQIPVSRSALQRRFKQEIGRTIQDEIISTRLKRAMDLLATTNLPIVEVSERCGFKHQEYFGAVMKQHLGRTPAEFRRESLVGSTTATRFRP